MDNQDNPRFTRAQLGFCVLAMIVGVGSAFAGMFILLGSDPEVPTVRYVLGVVETVLGLILTGASLWVLHGDYQKRFN